MKTRTLIAVLSFLTITFSARAAKPVVLSSILTNNNPAAVPSIDTKKFINTFKPPPKLTRVPYVVAAWLATTCREISIQRHTY